MSSISLEAQSTRPLNGIIVLKFFRASHCKSHLRIPKKGLWFIYPNCGIQFSFSNSIKTVAAPGGVLKNTGSINMSLMVCDFCLSLSIKRTSSSLLKIDSMPNPLLHRFGSSLVFSQWWVLTAMLSLVFLYAR